MGAKFGRGAWGRLRPRDPEHDTTVSQAQVQQSTYGRGGCGPLASLLSVHLFLSFSVLSFFSLWHRISLSSHADPDSWRRVPPGRRTGSTRRRLQRVHDKVFGLDWDGQGWTEMALGFMGSLFDGCEELIGHQCATLNQLIALKMAPLLCFVRVVDGLWFFAHTSNDSAMSFPFPVIDEDLV
ncbi:uncharacterized protein J3D65DRAFT_91425 [Phyllosticta citribraziliensis]|uniref:Uncharacterized protein n=1 Tax=Phyllosticta citribraziliensis TaxID=989973 RepID=A0ABR1LBR7_9PEZI